MRKITAVILGCLLAARLAAASDRAEILSSVDRWVDAFNKGDRKAALEQCAKEASIIDAIPPFEWHGVDACNRWWNDYDSWTAKNGISDSRVARGKIRYFDEDARNAHLVSSATMTFKERGQPARESGVVFVMSLAKDSSGWRITGWSWASGTVDKPL